MKSLRLALAAGALAAASAPFATTSAQAVTCHPDFRIVCAVIGYACSALDHPKLGIECAPFA